MFSSTLLISKKENSSVYKFNYKQCITLVGIGLLFIYLGAFPYFVVHHQMDGVYPNSRNEILLPFGASLVIYFMLCLLFDRLKFGLFLKKLSLIILVVMFISQDISYLWSAQVEWIKNMQLWSILYGYKPLKSIISSKENDKNTVFMMVDLSKKYNFSRRRISPDELTDRFARYVTTYPFKYHAASHYKWHQPKKSFLIPAPGSGAFGSLGVNNKFLVYDSAFSGLVPYDIKKNTKGCIIIIPTKSGYPSFSYVSSYLLAPFYMNKYINAGNHLLITVIPYVKFHKDGRGVCSSASWSDDDGNYSRSRTL